MVAISSRTFPFNSSRVAESVWNTRTFSVAVTVRPGGRGGQYIPPNREMRRPGKIFHSVSMEMLAYGMCHSPCQQHEFRMNR